MFEQTFKNVDYVLRKDAGSWSELDCVEQISWVLFENVLTIWNTTVVDFRPRKMLYLFMPLFCDFLVHGLMG